MFACQTCKECDMASRVFGICPRYTSGRCVVSFHLGPEPPTHASLSLFVFVPPGESGLGKSTLINSLFLTDLYSPEYPGPSHRIKKTVKVKLLLLPPRPLLLPPLLLLCIQLLLLTENIHSSVRINSSSHGHYDPSFSSWFVREMGGGGCKSV